MRKHQRKTLLTLVLGLPLLAVTTYGQSDLVTALQSMTSKTPEQLQMGDPNINLPWQPVGPNDMLAVSVADCPELTRGFRVGENGELHLPLLNQNIPVNGLKPPEIELRIADALREQRLFVRPVVSVAVIEYRSRPIDVVGAVQQSVSFQAFGDVRLMDALARAQGLAPEAGPMICVTTMEAATDGTRNRVTKNIPIRELMSGRDASLNVALSGGDEVRVPEADKVYVVGNVKSPGAFMIHEDSETTVLKMLAQSQGLMPYSKSDAFVYRLKPGSKERVEIPIPLRRILQRKTPDMALLPDDILYIPENAGKHLTATMLEGLTGIGAYAAVARF
jgi:polysaccharide export outer membrane protein